MAIPLCEYFGKCGGCSGQHIDYTLQLENKKNRLSKVTNFSEVKVFSAKEYHYRNRIDFFFYPGGIGLRDKSGKIIAVEKCVIAEEGINELLSEVKDYFLKNNLFNLNTPKSTFLSVTIRVTHCNDSGLCFVLNENSPLLDQGVEAIKSFSKQSSAKNILINVGASLDTINYAEELLIKGENKLEEKYLGKTFYHPLNSFFQNNFVLAEKMQEQVHALLESYGTTSSYLLDLYAGVGTFGIINANLFKAVTLIENVSSAIAMAKLNIIKNEVKNAEALVLDAKHLRRIKFKQPLWVITDPPRSGMEMQTIQQIKELKPIVLIYISCNLEQLRKDLLKFKNYKVNSVALFDLFPQTLHAEAVVELVRG